MSARPGQPQASHKPAPPAEDLLWQQKALCTQVCNPDIFFPEGKGGHPGLAKRVCMLCEVRTQCLDYALAHDETFGVWGGTTNDERRQIRRNRRREGAA